MENNKSTPQQVPGRTFGPKGILRSVTGDFTMPQGSSMRYIVTFCNNNNENGAYESAVLAKKWPGAATSYKSLWREKHGKMPVGETQFVQVRSDLAVVNCIVKTDGKVNDKALLASMDKLRKEVISNSGSVHMAISSYEDLKDVVTKELIERGINVTVYTAATTPAPVTAAV